MVTIYSFYLIVTRQLTKLELLGTPRPLFQVIEILYLFVYDIFFPPGPPDAPKQCLMVNQTSESVSLVCGPGYGGGLVQRLHMEVSTNILKTP